MAAPARGIPLWRRDGTIAAFVMVDAEDFERLSRWRWKLTRDGYAARTINGSTVQLQRVLMGLAVGDPRQVDHENRDRLDYRRSNLRVVPGAAANGQNQGRRGGSSRFRGVAWHKVSGRWWAYVTLAGRRISAGYWQDETQAAVAAERLRLKVMPYTVPDPELAPLLEAT